MGVWMSQDKNRKNAPGYYIHFEKGNCFIAGGVWCPEPSELKQIRKEIEFFHDDLEAVLSDKKFTSEFTGLDKSEGNMLKKAPKDFDPTHPAIELLKLKSFTASHKINEKDFTDKDFSKKIAKQLIALKPMNDFLRRALEIED
jgi:uncharacterized protein (TIGR02453 family)